ncbi:glycosyltransferase [Shewanella chilikensis]|uniref:glycosyltransferase n=1 Tax=Shewanella chilikensis TaxID=558541 RepID=UPI001CFB1573|nr:glycosyltransferase [Shewanella chilikensis]
MDGFYFSVLMSVYEKDDPVFLEQALDSLKFQTVLASEIVLVFDGPLPEILENVVTRYSSVLPIVILKLPVNVGLGYALNRGLELCKYDWVFRMDSDDICRNDRFEIQCNFIKDNPSVDLFGGGISEFVGSGETIGCRVVPETNKSIRSAMAYYSPFNHVTVAFRKKSVSEVGGYEGGRNFQEDYYLWIKLAKTKAIFANIPQILVDVRCGDDMLSRRGGLDYFIKEIKVSLAGLKNGVIPLSSFCKNFVVKFMVRLSPLFVRRVLYKTGRRLRNR